MKRKLLLPIFLLLAYSNVPAQTYVKPATQPAHINTGARFRSLDSTTPIRMADYRGKVVVMALWASWCGACRMAVSGLGDMQKEFADRGVSVIALSNEDPRKAYRDVRIFSDSLPPEYKVGWISSVSAEQLMTRKDVLPQIFVMRDGVILKTFVGWHPTMTASQLLLVLNEAQETKR